MKLELYIGNQRIKFMNAFSIFFRQRKVFLCIFFLCVTLSFFIARFQKVNYTCQWPIKLASFLGEINTTSTQSATISVPIQSYNEVQFFLNNSLIPSMNTAIEIKDKEDFANTSSDFLVVSESGTNFIVLSHLNASEYRRQEEQLFNKILKGLVEYQQSIINKTKIRFEEELKLNLTNLVLLNKQLNFLQNQTDKFLRLGCNKLRNKTLLKNKVFKSTANMFDCVQRDYRDLVAQQTTIQEEIFDVKSKVFLLRQYLHSISISQFVGPLTCTISIFGLESRKLYFFLLVLLSLVFSVMVVFTVDIFQIASKQKMNK